MGWEERIALQSIKEHPASLCDRSGNHSSWESGVGGGGGRRGELGEASKQHCSIVMVGSAIASGAMAMVMAVY